MNDNLTDEQKARDRFCGDPGARLLKCGICKHYFYRNDVIGCDAFPNGIPLEILTEQVDHTKPYKGDNGIVFRAKE